MLSVLRADLLALYLQWNIIFKTKEKGLISVISTFHFVVYNTHCITKMCPLRLVCRWLDCIIYPAV